MKTLMLLRHAKSSWDHPGLRDFDRPLAPRGRRAAPAMGAHIQSKGLVPDLVLCSTARRARETWSLAGTMLEGEPALLETDLLYGAGPGQMLEEVRLHGQDTETVMIVAHNPGMEDLAMALVGTGPQHDLDLLHRKYPTGALVVIDFDVPSWDQVAQRTGSLRCFVRPRDLMPD